MIQAIRHDLQLDEPTPYWKVKLGISCHHIYSTTNLFLDLELVLVLEQAKVHSIMIFFGDYAIILLPSQ